MASNRTTEHTYVQVDGAEDVAVKVDQYAQRISDWGPFFSDVTEGFQHREEAWFGRQGERSWPALSPEYAQWKAQAYPGKPILVRTGNLKDSLTGHRAKLAETPHDLWLGSDVEYAKYHLLGTKNMPARRPLAPLLRLQAGIAALLERHIKFGPLGLPR